jgi:hypothetical protein
VVNGNECAKIDADLDNNREVILMHALNTWAWTRSA